MALARELETFVVAFTPPVRPKKKTGDTSYALDSRVMMLYFRSAAGDVPIVADIYDRTLTSPDLMLEFVTQAEYEDPAALNEVKGHWSALNPRLGTCLFVVNPGADAKLSNVGEGIQTITAGFDPAKMEPILDRLA